MKNPVKTLYVIVITLFIITISGYLYTIYCYFSDIKGLIMISILSNFCLIGFIFTIIALLKEEKKLKTHS
jgi:formate-dependent nitrite reductase membrane component NrfD